MSLQRPESAVIWDLRSAWAAMRVIVCSLTPRCQPDRVQGRVCRVAATGAFVVIIPTSPNGKTTGAELHVPVVDVLAIHRPHFFQEAT